jgi:hypothetical protein
MHWLVKLLRKEVQRPASSSWGLARESQMQAIPQLARNRAVDVNSKSKLISMAPQLDTHRR